MFRDPPEISLRGSWPESSYREPLGVTEASGWAEGRREEEPRAHGEEEGVIFVLYVRYPGAFV